jgi:hypothetical protein
MTKINDVGNQGRGMEQEQTCGRVKPVTGYHNPLLLIIIHI